MLKSIKTLSGKEIPLPGLSIALEEDGKIVIWIYPQVGANRFASKYCTLSVEELPEFIRFYYADTSSCIEVYFDHKLTYEEAGSQALPAVRKRPEKGKLTFTLAELGLAK